MNSVLDDILMHYGMPRRSGRYPWGSGENPYQHSGDFLSRVQELKEQGLSETEIAKNLGLSTTEYRRQKTLANNERRALLVKTAKGLREKGYSLDEIAKQMGYANDSSVRSLLNENSEARMNKARNTADFLKEKVNQKGMIDVSAGTELSLNISKNKMGDALELLQQEGYEVYKRRVQQVTNPGKWTTVKVLCPPGTEYKDIYATDKIFPLDDYISRDGGNSFDKAFVYPKSMDSKRLKIRYAEEGGVDKDGVIEIRRGVKDLSLGNSNYAQVRILVDGTHYLKGMAVYSDDLPDGVDVLFNTNKKQGTPVIGPKSNTVLKPITNDPNNPFGSYIKEHGGQSYYDDPKGDHIDPLTGKKQSLSLINKRADEGDWGDWSNKLPSQFLVKQSRKLINSQLNLDIADKVAEFDEICSLNNPTIKRTLLKSFSDDCDSAAVHLKAAALPRQSYQVILPLKDIKDTEVYAPNYHDGETVALIRYPHGGTFEIPILKVNNKLAEGKKVLGNTPADAIGINHKVAERLSGADFDGDTVMVIPCNSSRSNVHITSTPPLKGLEGFDPKEKYGGKEPGTFKPMMNTQTEMGKVSNLITDMTLKGAKPDEIAKAVRHSMVVIDAEKHGLDYKQSEIDNDIDSLKNRYQGRYDENGNWHKGASTLISLAKSETSVPKRQGSPKIDKETGELKWKTADDLYYEKKKVNKKTGEVTTTTVMRTQKSTKMAEVKDAHLLSTGTPQEEAYANYANKMKALANQARKEMINTERLEYKASAKATYKNEVDSLDSKLRIAELNNPRERRAQIIANSVIDAKIKSYPDLSKKEIKKISQQALTSARIQAGASRKETMIKLTDREWEAIQAGAISDHKLTRILKYTDIDEVRERATPKVRKELSPAKINRIAAMKASGYTTDYIANALNISPSTVSKYLKS